MAELDSDVPAGTNGLTDRQRAFVDGLRDLADCLESHPDLISSVAYTGFVGFHEFRHDDIPAEMAATVRRAGGRWEKQEGANGDFHLVRKFGPHEIVLYTARENVCERVVVSTETVTREVPDPDLLAAVPTVTVTEEVEHVDWVCPPSLIREGVTS